MRENDFALEAAILTTDLEFLWLDFNNIDTRVLFSDKFDGFGHLRLIRHRSRCKDGKLWRIICENIEKFPCGLGISIFTESSRLIDEQNDIFFVKHTNIDSLFSVFSFMLHDVNLLGIVVMMVEHFIGTMKIRNDKIHIFLVSARPWVDNSGVKVCGFFDGSFHRCKGEFLLFVVSVPADLDSDWTDETRVNNLHFGVLLVNKLALVDKFWQCNWSAGLSTANHSLVKDKSGLINRTLITECAFNSLYEFNLTVIGLDIKRREELVIVGVIDKLRVLDHDNLVIILVVLLQSLDAILQIQYQSLGHLHLLWVVHKTFSPEMRKNPHDLYQNVYQLKNLWIVDLLVHLVLSNVISHVKKCHQLHLQLFVLQSELHLHALHWVWFHHQFNVLLEVVFHDL